MAPSHPLNEPPVRRRVRFVLRRNGIPPHELDDAAGDVTLLTLESLVGKEPPADLKEWAALAGTIARNYAIDQIRKKKTRWKNGDAGLTDQEDSVEPLPNDDWRDPIDAKRLVGILEDQFRSGEMPEHGEEILEATAAGVGQKEIAEELGITESAVRNRLHRMRQTFAGRVEEEGLSQLKRGKG
jgi:RNA polymerase sigma factor (sigma-70 family)